MESVAVGPEFILCKYLFPPLGTCLYKLYAVLCCHNVAINQLLFIMLDLKQMNKAKF